ncbi:hypothetical protein PVK06_033597 [Gossypium arboreum]|uniref:Uncharacterized protein n=1 Tax=Gossypium arboreum TaxID=29729 RepID=A0ABR0NER0_GOSAR|nr:hypothetical protein PVK06_033597 [Gossypium arboreum]
MEVFGRAFGESSLYQELTTFYDKFVTTLYHKTDSVIYFRCELKIETLEHTMNARNELIFDNRACDPIVTWNRALLDNPCVYEGSNQMEAIHNVSENQRWRKPTFGLLNF